MATFLGCLGLIGLMAILLVVGAILKGYVLTVLWAWFIIPTFDAPPLGLVPAIGIVLVVEYLVPTSSHNDDKEWKSTGEAIAASILLTIGWPLLALSFGWVVHLFM